MREVITVQKVELPRQILKSMDGVIPMSWSPIRIRYLCNYRGQELSLSTLEFKAYKKSIRKIPSRPKLVFISAVKEEPKQEEEQKSIDINIDSDV